MKTYSNSLYLRYFHSELVINLQQTVVLDAVSLVVCKNRPQYLATVVAGTVVIAAIVAVTPPGIYRK